MTAYKVIVGAGKTGLSCAQYLARHDVAFRVMDSDASAQKRASLQAVVAGAELGLINGAELSGADEIIISPGVPLTLPEVSAAIRSGVPVTGDVAMFARLADKPFAGITGSNGKSTVTALVGEMAGACGVRAGVGGNIGTPCLDLLDSGFEAFVIEVSSYQLEVVDHLDCDVAVVLNLSPDHLNRYPGVDAYYAAKARIYRGCKVAVVNRETHYAFDLGTAQRLTFGSDEPVGEDDFGLRGSGPDPFLAKGVSDLIRASELKMMGAHNRLNALAALAVGHGLGLPVEGMLQALRQFGGLAHRCEFVGVLAGATYINDSKATNIGSTLAALKGFGSGAKRNVVLILGGQSKAANFTALKDVIVECCRLVYGFGEDRSLIAGQLAPEVEVQLFEGLDEVMDAVFRKAKTDDLVLFSPACASLDQFRNFEHRGDVFRSVVQGRMDK